MQYSGLRLLNPAPFQRKVDLLSGGFNSRRDEKGPYVLCKNSVPGQSGFNSRLDLISVDLIGRVHCIVP